VFNAVNPSVYAARENPVPAKSAYAAKVLQDWARLAGLRIEFPPAVFPVNSVKAMRACVALGDSPRMIPFARAVFEAYFRDGQDISRDEAIRAICARVEIDADTLLAAIARSDVKERLRANTDELIARGGFGSPTFFVDGQDMYFGNDSLPLVRAALGARRRD
jgi:2-hydroxychromene-2-carboxylate isomerase